MRWLSSLSVWMLLASPGVCQQTSSEPDCPSRCAQPTIVALPRSSGSSSAAKVDHLLQAAKHLDQAGLTEEAAEYRRRAGLDHMAVHARIKQLEREIDDLRGLSSAGIQILAELKIIEIGLDELRALGLGEALFDAHPRTLPESIRDSVEADLRLANKTGPGCMPSICGTWNSDAAVLAKLKAVCDGRRARVIAEPKMVTVSGRKAEINIGGDVPIRTRTEDGRMKTEQRFVGTRWTVWPLLIPGGKLRLQMATSVSRLASDKTAADGSSIPGPLRTFKSDTTLELLDGQTAVTGGLITGGAKSGDQEFMTLTLVTARVVTPIVDRGQPVPRSVPTTHAIRPLPPTVTK